MTGCTALEGALGLFKVGAMGHANVGQSRFFAICTLRNEKSATLRAIPVRSVRFPLSFNGRGKQWLDTEISFARKPK